jgi:hypothetical protein
MRKQAKKLTLHRETLRALDARRLVAVAAMDGNTFEIQTTCACTDSCNCNPSAACTGLPCAGTQGCPGQTDEIYSGCATNC